jgi:hypothetical protein
MMIPSLFSLGPATAAVRRARLLACTRFSALLLLGMTLQAPDARAQGSGGFDITSVNLTNFQIVGNELRAAGTVTGTLAGLPFTTNITNFVLQVVPDNPATPAVECSVLNLSLAPINLALLGLHVDTSAICLDITADPGGGLLGNLLCSLAGGGPLGSGIPVLPTAGQLTELQAGLVDLIEGSLDLSPVQPNTQNSVCTGECEVLALALGPLDLSLLGLNVSLDDCSGGPVQVCVSATQSEGLLGSLLCGLAGAGPINLTLADIGVLGRRATELLADGTLSRRDEGVLTALLGRLIR